MVQSVLLDFRERAHPLFLVGGWIARLREAAVLDRASQKQRVAVDEQLAPLDAYLAQSEGYGHVPSVVLHHHRVQLRRELIPQLGLGVYLGVKDMLVDNDVYGVVFQVGNHLFAPDADAGL